MLTFRSAWFANCSMKPLTPRMFEDSALLVVGMPYIAWRQAGVTVDAHDEGTAREVRFVWIWGGVENDGTPDAIANLIPRAPWTSGSASDKRYQ